MTLSGILPLRNAVRLGYPFELAIRSLQRACDEVVVLVDPASDDDTLRAVRRLVPDRIVESVWDMGNHEGHTNCEISIQTQKACDAARGDWILSLQADELLHENDADQLRRDVVFAEGIGITGIEFLRLYFWGRLDRVRIDWTIWMLRLFKRGRWKPDVDGAMRFDPSAPGERRMQTDVRLFHYSRVGDPVQIAERVRNLDGFFHPPDRIRTGAIEPYDFALRKLDTYVVGHTPESAETALCVSFPVEGHPAAVLEWLHGK